MKIIEPPLICCKKCHEYINTTPTDFGNPKLDTEERSLGYETLFTWKYENECNSCHNKILIIIEGYEYPENYFNHDEAQFVGCILLKKYKLESKNN